MRILRLFNEEEGKKYLSSFRVTTKDINALSLLGISGIGNMLGAIKTAKYFEMDEHDVIFTVFTDSVDLYQSRLSELRKRHGRYSAVNAANDHAGPIEHQSIDYFKELSYYEKKAIHNLKYFTWVEQQGKSHEEINAQWDPEYWRSLLEDEVGYFDTLIAEFNQMAR
jgi:hypothetical protein